MAQAANAVVWMRDSLPQELHPRIVTEDRMWFSRASARSSACSSGLQA